MITSIHHESKVYNRISDKRNFLSKVYFQRNVNGVTSDFFEKVSFNLRISSLLEDIKRAPKGSMFLRWNIEKLESWPRWSRTVAGTICSFSCRHVWQFVIRVMCLRVIFHSNFGKMSIMLAHREFVSQFEISLSNVPLTFNKI